MQKISRTQPLSIRHAEVLGQGTGLVSLRKELISMVELEKALQRVGLQAACKKRCCEPGILCECVRARVCSVCVRARV